MWNYLFQVEMYDASDDRFWYGSVTISSDQPESYTSLLGQIQQAIAARLSGAQYESLVAYIEAENPDILEQLQGVYWHAT